MSNRFYKIEAGLIKTGSYGLSYSHNKTLLFLYIVENAECTGENRGKLKTSIRQLTACTQESYNTTYKWIRILGKDGAIVWQECGKNQAIITVCNYERFNGVARNVATMWQGCGNDVARIDPAELDVASPAEPLRIKNKELRIKNNKNEKVVSDETTNPIITAARKGRKSTKILKPTKEDIAYRQTEATKVRESFPEICSALNKKWPELDIDDRWIDSQWQSWALWMQERYEFPHSYKKSFTNWVNKGATGWHQSRSNYREFKKHNSYSTPKPTPNVDDGPSFEDYRDLREVDDVF